MHVALLQLQKMTGVYFNKAEALREKEAAGKMISNKDYIGARDKLCKARQVFPGLSNIDAMVAVCDILAASKITIPGYEIEYYWVLGIIPSASYDDISCQHEKLLKLLMPIKNKFPGVDLALRLIDEAFSVLSDRDKRFSYDLRRKVSWEGYESSVVNLPVCCSISDKEKGITTQSSDTLGEKNEIVFSTGVEKDLELDLFASENDKHVVGNMEELGASSSNVSSDENLEKETPSLFPKSSPLQRLDQDFYNFGDARKPFHFEKGQIWAAHYSFRTSQNYRYAKINTSISSIEVTWLKPVPGTIAERRWCDLGLPVPCGPFCLDSENTETMNSPALFSHNCSWVSGITQDQFEIYPKKGEIWAVYENWDLDEWSYNPEILEGCKLRLVEFLSDYSKYLGAKCAYLEKVNGFRGIFGRVRGEGDDPVTLHISPVKLYMLSHKVPAYRFTGGEIDVGVIAGMLELDLLALPKYLVDDIDTDITSNVENLESSRFSPPLEELLSLPWVNPEPDLETLGTNWSMSNYIAGQIWAVYGEKDSMPRQYVRINNVDSRDQVCVTFLEPQPILDYEKTWVKERLPFVCGTHAATGSTVNLKFSQLSHVVKCLQSTTKSVYRIYPMKGQIWALYKNWESKWKHFNYKNSEFDIVEILSNLSEGSGITIARLTEVKGCLTFFHKQHYEGFDLSRVVSKAEVVCFSHQIPAFRVPGIGNYGIPENSWHLEPNALPCKHIVAIDND